MARFRLLLAIPVALVLLFAPLGAIYLVPQIEQVPSSEQRWRLRICGAAAQIAQGRALEAQAAKQQAARLATRAAARASDAASKVGDTVRLARATKGVTKVVDTLRVRGS